MTFDVDGFTLGKNPSSTGGGFTVISTPCHLTEEDETKTLVISHTIYKNPFTNNEAELLAIAYAAFRAGTGDTIRTDSVCAYHWSLKGNCKARPDLNSVAQQTYQWIQEKQLELVQIPRELNLAGHYNEQHH